MLSICLMTMSGMDPASGHSRARSDRSGRIRTTCRELISPARALALSNGSTGPGCAWGFGSALPNTRLRKSISLDPYWVYRPVDWIARPHGRRCDSEAAFGAPETVQLP